MGVSGNVSTPGPEGLHSRGGQVRYFARRRYGSVRFAKLLIRGWRKTELSCTVGSFLVHVNRFTLSRFYYTNFILANSKFENEFLRTPLGFLDRMWKIVISVFFFQLIHERKRIVEKGKGKKIHGYKSTATNGIAKNTYYCLELKGRSSKCNELVDDRVVPYGSVNYGATCMEVAA